MSARAATILAIAAVVSTVCLYGSFAQVPGPERAATERAIVIGPPAVPGQELPGRYQLTRLTDSTVMVIDTHTDQCWSKSIAQQWRDWGSPVKQK